MKAAEPKSTSAQQAGTAPFFSKENGEGSHDQEREPFFPGSGNEAVQRKLTVGDANDSYEKEADRVADHVVQNISGPKTVGSNAPSVQKKSTPTITPLVQRKCAECEKEEKLQKKEEQEEVGIQRKPIFDSRAEKEDGDQKVQRKCKHCEEEEKKVQRKEDNSNSIGSGSLESNLSATKGGGSPLAPDVNQSMSQAFGHDFSGVRVHTGDNAAKMSEGLNAQAFTHGNDIYFNEGKYSTNDSKGQHLLAHELTHTVQQGNGNNTSAISNSIQKDETPAAPAKPTEGFAKVKGACIEIHLTDFPLKQYASPYSLGKDNRMPKEKRSTDQKGIWKEKTGKHVSNFVNNFVKKEKLTTEPILQLTLKNNPTAKLYGTKEEITKEMAVPFWDLGGNAVIHQVEHAIDWQVLGKKADNINNLVLLDKTSNLKLGNSVFHDINKRLKVIIEYYKSEIPELDGLTAATARAETKYPIIFDSFTQDVQTPSGSIISKSNIGGTNEPYKQEHFKLEKADIPEGKFVLRTSEDRAGYLLPYCPTPTTVGRFTMQTFGNPKITAISLDPIINGGKDIFVTNRPGEKIENESPTSKIFLTNSRRLAARLRDFIGVKNFSEIKFDEPEITSNFGLRLTGKVDTDISFLKENNVDISFELLDGDFSIQASISDVAKFPKPFNVTYSSLFIKASSKDGLSIGGDLQFEIKKLGKGKLSALAGGVGFAINGKFEFESKKFEGSNINFTFKDKVWTIGGELKVAKDAFKGIKEANIKLNYAQDKITFDGGAQLDVPGIDKITVDGEFSSADNFRVHGTAGFKKMPGVKSGKVEIEVTRANEDYELKVSGDAVPDLPKMPGEMKGSFKVSYDSKTEVFKVGGELEYTKGKVYGKLEIGVTNAAVVDGKIQNTKGAAIIFYGSGTLKITLIEKKATAELIATVKPEGGLFISGTAKVEPTPLMNEFKEEKVIDFPSLKIPVIGVPFVSIFLEIGGGVKFYFNWQPITISGSITLPETDITKLAQAKFGINLNAASTATAGIGLQLSVGIGAEAAVIQVKGTITGFAGIEIKGKVEADIKMELDLEKGLKMTEATGKLDLTPSAKFSLTGAIGVYLNLFVTTIQVWEWKKVLADGSVDLSSLGGLGLELPIKFDANGGVILPRIDDIKVVKKPELTAQKGRELIDTVFNDKKPDASDENVKKQIREAINKELRAGLKVGQSANQSLDVNRIAGDVQNKYGLKDPKLASFVIESVKTEMATISNDFYSVLEKQLTGSRESLTVKLGRLDEFDRTWAVWRDTSLSNPLREKLTAEDAAKKGKPVQRKPIFESEAEKDDNKNAVQKSSAANGAPPITPQTESNIHSSAGKGESLPSHTKAEMETAMGKELPDVTIHHDSNAASMNQELEANAFTHGKDVYFNNGKYDPESKEGKRLLAHELTHVAQQDNGTVRRDKDDQPPVKKGKVIPGLVPMFHPFSGPQTFKKTTALKGKGSISVTATAQVIKSPEILHTIKKPTGEEKVPYEYVLQYERQVDIKTESGSWISLRFKAGAFLPFEEMEKNPTMNPFSTVKMLSDFQLINGTVEGDYGSENVKKLLAKKLKQLGENPADASKYLFVGTIGHRIYEKNPHVLMQLSGFLQIYAPNYTWFYLTTEQQYDYLVDFMMRIMDDRMPKRLQKLPAPVQTPPDQLPQKDKVRIDQGDAAKRKKMKDPRGPVDSTIKGQQVDPDTAAEKDEEDGYELPGWLEGILATLGMALLIIGAVFAFAAIIVYFIPALAFAAVVKTLMVIVVVAGLIYSLYTRYKEAKKHGNISFARILAVSILDTIGVAPIIEAVTDKSMLTGEKLNLSEKEKFEKGTGGILSLLGTFLGVRGWIKGKSAPAPPKTPKAPNAPPAPEPPKAPSTVDKIPVDPPKPAAPPLEPPKPVTPAPKDKVPVDPSKPVTPEPPKPVPPTPTDKVPVDPSKPVTPEPPKPVTPTPKDKVPVDPSKPTPAPKSPEATAQDKATPPPKRRRIVPSPDPKPKTPAPVPDKTTGKTPKPKDPRKPKDPAKGDEPKPKDPAEDADTGVKPTGVGSLKVGDKVSVPYGENGARVRAEVIEITDTDVAIKYNPKGTKGEPGTVTYRVRKDLWNERVKSSEFVPWKGLRAWLMRSRPKYRKGLVDEVWNDAKAKNADGKVRDPNPPHEILEWDPSKSRFDQWHMGHRKGYEYSKLVDQLVREEITWEQFLEQYNNKKNYYPEHPDKNMSHVYEEREISGADE
jgi:hypothetical protein